MQIELRVVQQAAIAMLTKLPSDILLLILSEYLPEPDDVDAVERTCRSLKVASRSRTRWLNCQRPFASMMILNYPNLINFDGVFSHYSSDLFKSKLSIIRSTFISSDMEEEISSATLTMMREGQVRTVVEVDPWNRMTVGAIITLDKITVTHSPERWTHMMKNIEVKTPIQHLPGLSPHYRTTYHDSTSERLCLHCFGCTDCCQCIPCDECVATGDKDGMTECTGVINRYGECTHKAAHEMRPYTW